MSDRAGTTLKMAFPPALACLQPSQEWLRDAAAALLERAVPQQGPRTPAWYTGEGAHIAAQLRDPELGEVWSQFGRLYAQFESASDACVAAARRGRQEVAAASLQESFSLVASLTTLLTAGSLREVSLLFAERERRIAQRYEQDFLDAAHIGRFSVRLSDEALVSCDESFATLFEGTPASLRGREARAVLGKAAWRELSEGLKPGDTRRVRVRRLRPGAASLEIVGYVTGTAARGTLDGFVVNVSQAEAEAQHRRLLSSAIEALEQLVVITDAKQHIVYVNGAFARMTGYAADEVLGRSPRFLHGPETSQAALALLRESARAGRAEHAELMNYRKSGEAYWVDVSMVPVPDASGEITHWVAIGHDITARKLQEAEITRLAMEDHLTGLPNRRAAETRLAIEWSRARRRAGSFAVALVDVDRFKLVNDQYGHQVGDQALAHIAGLLGRNRRGGDWICRWGGEEFLVCLHDLDARGALAAAERARKLIRGNPLVSPRGELTLTVSMGVALYDPQLESLDALVAQADALLYEAKRTGRDRVVSNAQQAARGPAIGNWERSQVHTAIQEQRVVAAFQPIVDLRSGETVAEEALARIVARDDTLVPAGEFIGAAEALHLISAIDRTVSESALERSASAGASGVPPRTRFINLSPQFLADSEQVEGLLERARALRVLPSARNQPLVIELTERQTGDMKMLKKQLRPLLQSGFGLALDDFGSGQSSFMYLADLPLSFIKIEGWMVRRIVSDARIRQLVASLVGTARSFELRTVAECVEDGQAAQVLCDLGVDWAQGYFFAEPAVLH
ncbi:MAG: EAL domain-containing protein [Burkholderiales bacterium]|nr:EAL domain-containing protein [Burkholderiales bacterium]